MKFKLVKPSPSFLLSLGVLMVLAIVGKPLLRWAKAQYDSYRASTTPLVASDQVYQALRTKIQAQQPRRSLSRSPAEPITPSEQIFQAAIAPDLLGRSSQYEPYTHNGKLACARMVNRVLENALSQQIGQNPLYVPSMVEDLDAGAGQRLDQAQTQRGDLAIATGTDYAQGQWHIGICATDGCALVLSNSPFTSRFEWLSDANFDGAFAQYPGQTTFYRVTPSQRRSHDSGSESGLT
jgi:hypothetical protein